MSPKWNQKLNMNLFILNRTFDVENEIYSLFKWKQNVVDVE